eukprot:5286181-Pyramimonas_sp.AAC.1
MQRLRIRHLPPQLMLIRVMGFGSRAGAYSQMAWGAESRLLERLAFYLRRRVAIGKLVRGFGA